MKGAVALAALVASTVALAQQTTPGQPRTSTTTQEQTAPPADSRARLSETDKQTLTRDCARQVEASHPTVPEKDVEAYCEKQVNNLLVIAPRTR